ncbi:hypothetical protein HMPREF3038_00916 [Akkermansia sp. KLE1797]|nr:hypothetical protein HMPREF3038_00916 [Akkermansia sp. KLE1797]KXU54437.1 hypothetical protein HMPREF3039_01329 [Akkermansia sp. KLE1798]KZA04829.1 hypothetical protein HMPREF1326_01406 [Akkermansia sp. KLE1605]
MCNKRPSITRTLSGTPVLKREEFVTFAVKPHRERVRSLP